MLNRSQFSQGTLFDAGEYHVDRADPSTLTPNEWRQRTDLVWHGSVGNDLSDGGDYSFQSRRGFHAGSRGSAEHFVAEQHRNYLHAFRMKEPAHPQMFTDQGANQGEHNALGYANSGMGSVAYRGEDSDAADVLDQGKPIQYINEGEDPGSISYVFPRPGRQLATWRQDAVRSFSPIVQRYRDLGDGLQVEKVRDNKRHPDAVYDRPLNEHLPREIPNPNHDPEKPSYYYENPDDPKERVAVDNRSHYEGPGHPNFWGPIGYTPRHEEMEDKGDREKHAINASRAKHGLPEYTKRTYGYGGWDAQIAPSKTALSNGQFSVLDGDEHEHYEEPYDDDDDLGEFEGEWA